MLGATLTTAATWQAHQRFRGQPVEVDVVDDRDVAGAQPAGQRLRPPVEPHGADHARRIVAGAGPPQGGKPHHLEVCQSR